jgi:hypothetical protein
MNTSEELLDEAREACDRFWFVQSLIEVERTTSTITVHLVIGPELYVQAYLSELSGRLSFALVDPSGRLYGRDRERGTWHRHPFDDPDRHEPTPEGMSSRPLLQFMAEVEEIVLENELI